MNAFLVNVGIQFVADAQSFLGGGAANQIDDHLMADQRSASPIRADETEHSVFDLVPFACAWREMADRYTQSGFIGKFLQRHFPQSNSIAIATPTISSNQKLGCSMYWRMTAIGAPAQLPAK